MKLEVDYTEIDGIGNYYGTLCVMEHEGKHYWIIENYDTNFEDISEWREIPKSLYDEILKHDTPS